MQRTDRVRLRIAGAALVILLLVPFAAGCGSKEPAPSAGGGTYYNGPIKPKGGSGKVPTGKRGAGMPSIND